MLSLTVSALCSQCTKPPFAMVYGGRTMGTTWSLHTLETPVDQNEIQSELDSLESIFSTWNPASEISRFNRHPAALPFAASAELAAAIQFAAEMHNRTEGVLDPTVGPLVAAFGYGPPALADPNSVPCFGAISFESASQTLIKQRASATLDFSCFVEGLALDRIASRLESTGHRSFLLEIGGELLARGSGPDGAGWPTGVQTPGAPAGQIFTTLRLYNEALATSGNYTQRGHIIDPRTRQPVTHDTVSVSVIARSAMQADAWATALLVHGAESGRPIAEHHGIEALFLKSPLKN